MADSKMFPFITRPWNPISGRCPYDCIYCWAKQMIKQYNMRKYMFESHPILKEFKRKFKINDFVFVQDMNSLSGLPSECIQKLFQHIISFPNTTFLLLDKKPQFYIDHIEQIPINCVLGTTIETDNLFFNMIPSKYTAYYQISKADIGCRLSDMLRIKNISKHKRFISIEPILDFSYHFIDKIKITKPWAVAVGYDNYNNRLPEPILNRTEMLIEKLEKFTTVYKKTIRKAWYEKCLIYV